MKKITKVFWISLVIAILFVGWGVFFPGHLTGIMEGLNRFFMRQFGWFYQISATLFLLFALFLIFSRYGRIKLGKDEDKPDFSRPTWIAMLFSAGMGIGLLFFGVSEPISHYVSPPYGAGGTSEAATLGLRYVFLHWGFHAWAMYAVIALILAYFKFRKGYPGLLSATLYPLLGDKVKGPLGIVIDTVAVFATIFGVAASLGLGSTQINAGLNYLFGLPNTFWIQLVIIGLVTALFILSAGTGLQRGIRYLSNTNMVLAVCLFAIFLFVGPTIFLLNLFTTTFGSYIQNLPSMGLRLAPFNKENAAWLQNWTIFYWAWWIAWAPFVGTFIARISRGRTIREFMIAVTVIPTLVCCIWFTVFGGTAIHMEHTLGFSISDKSLETAIFYVFEQLPATLILVILTLLLVAIFFITSADSAVFVLGMQTTGGSLNPPNIVKVTWGLILSASAVVLLLSGGLTAIQTSIIVSAFPLTFVLFAMAVSVIKSLNAEPRKQRRGPRLKGRSVRFRGKRKEPAR